eukprot:scaffold38832_cov24-Attheya_sp.AAC.1
MSSTTQAWTTSPASLGRTSSLGKRTEAGVASGSALGSIPFAKYEGLGNDFILIDDRDKTDPSLTPDESARLCDRNFCVGGDGVIFALAAPDGT